MTSHAIILWTQIQETSNFKGRNNFLNPNIFLLKDLHFDQEYFHSVSTVNIYLYEERWKTVCTRPFISTFFKKIDNKYCLLLFVLKESAKSLTRPGPHNLLPSPPPPPSAGIYNCESLQTHSLITGQYC